MCKLSCLSPWYIKILVLGSLILHHLGPILIFPYHNTEETNKKCQSLKCFIAYNLIFEFHTWCNLSEGLLVLLELPRVRSSSIIRITNFDLDLQVKLCLSQWGGESNLLLLHLNCQWLVSHFDMWVLVSHSFSCEYYVSFLHTCEFLGIW